MSGPDQHQFAVLALALALEALCGYPAWLYARVAHPVVWIGRLISELDGALNRDDDTARRRRLCGVLALVILLVVMATAAMAISHVLRSIPFGWAAEALLAGSLLAQRSLYTHVAAVSSALRSGGLAPGRIAVSHIVGRDPEALDEAGIGRAAIESLAENFSDGIVAPALWFALLGLPGMVLYKAINTADSMIGHRSPRHESFGWAAARLDDLVNLPASRLSALLIVLAAMAGGSVGSAYRAIRRDARHHRSPNAGWPEAALAGALDLRLAGPRVYDGTRVEDAWMGDGRADVRPDDIDAALRLYGRACAAMMLLVLAALLALACTVGFSLS
ncbi:adenosylcobinamide-phosphate synthase CbiB [Reyranella sp. CPCC 100927]|uniref:adenosylcobinamide-phosphate synthase CbiB n=1 Tax=Reyranella sp. CPCC 100927 TaxID=2599616 RepID=UPI0011B6F243|nr:adenosylcobinamide-phosphate synthase CbiB [Reyranella sp. CPCC 100927]TWT06055.1 cobalamin biosynthesis protein [Reyranella sp. CPCC 100927]